MIGGSTRQFPFAAAFDRGVHRVWSQIQFAGPANRAELDENLREWESEGRFHIFKTDFDGAHIDEEPGELVTDDWCEVLAYIAHIASIPPRVELFQQGSAGAYRRAAEFRDLAERDPSGRTAYLAFSTSYQRQAAEISTEARRLFDLMTAN